MSSALGTRWLWWWLTGYVAITGAVVGGMFWLRHMVLIEYSTPESIADWQSWREDVREQQANPGPVAREMPKSNEPPALVLMRDFFVVSLVGAVFFTSLLYWVVAWFMTGALSGSE